MDAGRSTSSRSTSVTPDQDAAREERLADGGPEARGNDDRVVGHAAAVHEVEQEVTRVADLGAHDAGSAGGHHLGADADRPSVISATSAVPPVTLVILPARPPSVGLTGRDHGLVEADSVLDPLSILMLEYQTVGERAITRAVTGSVPRRNLLDAARPALQLRGVALRGARARELGAELVDLLLELLVLVLGVDGVAHPAEQVATGLRRRAVSIGAKASWAPR